jgi:hypothetical protein
VLDFVIGLERSEDQRCGLVVVAVQLGGQFLFTRQEARDVEDVQDLEDEQSSALISASVDECDSELMWSAGHCGLCGSC